MAEESRRTRKNRAAFLGGVGALSLAAIPGRGRGQSTTIRMAGISFSDQFAEPFYGRESGVFAKAGLDVEVQSISTSAGIMAALAGGAIDVGVGDLVSSTLAMIAGVPITLFAGSSFFRATDPPLGSVIVATGSAIRQPRDLIGKTIALPGLAGLASVVMQAWLVQNGIPVQSVKLFEVPASAMPAALASGKVDAGLLGEPILTLARNEVRRIANPYDAVAKEYLFGGWFASKSWLAEDKERARRLVDAIYETARWANTHHDESFAILARNAKLDADKLKGMARVTYATSLTPALVQPSLNAALQFNVFKERVDANSIITRI